MDEILVSILCITYNHEDYIKDAIDGFLSQKVNFKYQIIIHDDASTDKTTEIIKEYEKKYPEMIIGMYEEENQYSKGKNLLQIMQEKVRGKYVAICEGDDYWIDTHKLQLQVDHLENHPECVLIIHDAVQINYLNGSIKAMHPYEYDKNVSAEEIILMPNGNPPTASMVCRKDMIKQDTFFYKVSVGDYPFQLFCLSKGEIYYFSRIMSVHRSFHKGSWSKKHTEITIKQQFIYCLDIIHFLVQYQKYTKGIFKEAVVSKCQGYVSFIIELYRDMSKEMFLKKCTEIDRETNFKFSIYLNRIQDIYSSICDVNYIAKEICEFCCKYKHIMIMGAGCYAKIVHEQLKKYNIDIDGFVVSDDQITENTYLEKPVWELKDIPYELDNMGIVIGINPRIWNQIMSSLKKYKIENFICPFLFEV